MSFLQLRDISLSFGPRVLFRSVNLNLDSKSRVALTGSNGAGKTTFMKVIAGLQERDSGEVITDRECRIGYLPQSGINHAGRTLKEEADTAFERFHRIEQECRDMEEEISRLGANASEELLHRHHDRHDLLVRSGFYDRDRQVQKVLMGLGFTGADLTRGTGEFSGGWQMRIALARILLESPDIALLDEPTNYLDLETREWLISFLADFPGGVLVVSHDRHFLDTVVRDVAELFLGRLKLYRGNYTQYETRRKEELVSLIEQYERQQEEIIRLETYIRRFRFNANRASQVQSRVKTLDKIERIELPENLKRVKIAFPPPPDSGRIALTLEGIGKSYGTHSVFSGLDLTIEKGAKLAVAGFNGAGKTTLLRIIAGRDPSHMGTVRFGAGIKGGYFSQDFEQEGDAGQTVIDMIEANATMESLPHVRDLLGSFLFSGDDIYKSIGVLSGGERSRVELLKLLLKPVNLLILDEPTNHLDLHSKDVLLDALKRYPGTVIFVSHDWYFLEKLSTSVLEIRDGKATYFPGDWSYYQYRRGQQDSAAGDTPQAPRPSGTGRVAAAPAADLSAGKLSHEDQKKQKGQLRKLEKNRDQLMEEVTALELELARLQARMGDPDVYSDTALSSRTAREIKEKEKELEQKTADWEKAEEELAAFIQN
jgi:ATP-binding cassette subfamily F protein 3